MEAENSPQLISPRHSTDQSSDGPSFIMPLAFESDYDISEDIAFLRNNYHIPFIAALGVYLPILYFGQKFMANREPMKLRVPLILWNSSLATFSIIGFSRVFPEFLYTLKHGFQTTICSNSFLQIPATALWTYLFVLSKIPELVDTIFLVSKKQKLIFLHVYHHASVLIFSWFVLANQLAPARWFCTMNYGVHSLMYTYYTLKATPHLIKIPKWVSLVITTLQTLQMVAGTYVVVASLYTLTIGQKCDTNFVMSIAGLLIYVSYFVLFSKFFYNAYISPKPKQELIGVGKKKD